MFLQIAKRRDGRDEKEGSKDSEEKGEGKAITFRNPKQSK
jgi:hypothetical protein